MNLKTMSEDSKTPTKATEVKKSVTKSKAKNKVEEKKDGKKNVEVPAKFKKLVEEVEKMSALELSELVKVLEDRFGVSAAAPMAVAPAGVAGGEGKAEEEEKSEFAIELVAAGDQKIQVIKIVRELTGKGLKDAKDMVDGAPKVLKENVPKKEADEIKKKLETAGGKVNLK
ncbi:MAG: hypothetical protein ACD_63C00244G0001 [uncultured bacterium]|nr:MAG: hypothetical protein ACD_63C00244G0001 [uncultured bacterium]